MSTQHTPGPWAICTKAPNTYWVVGRTIGAADPKDGRRVCDVCEWGGEMADANARLIAAAPELLAACKVAFDQTCSTGRPKDWEQLRAAIATATGEQP